MNILENVYIFIAKKENRLIVEQEVEEGNSVFSIVGGVVVVEDSKQYQHSALRLSTSELSPYNLTAHGHCKVRAKEYKAFHSVHIFFLCRIP